MLIFIFLPKVQRMKIEEIIKKTVNETVKKLKSESLLQDAYKRTEKHLKNYPDWKKDKMHEDECLKIENALKTIEKDCYYSIIEYKYFDNMTLEEIAEIFDVDVSTVSRQRHRLITRLKWLLFPEDF